MSRFRSGCHGMQIDTGQQEDHGHVDRKDRLCLVYRSTQDVEDEQHFLFNCPVYNSLRVIQACFSTLTPHMFTRCETYACSGFIRICVSLTSSILTEFR